MTQKTAVVTGVTGQMGSYFVEFLLNLGLKVVGTARRTSKINNENLRDIKDHPNFSILPMDLGDGNSIRNLIGSVKPDYFINCAANSFVGSSWDYPEEHFELNALGVLRQLEAIKSLSPQTKYLNFGSSEEFGDVLFWPQSEGHPPRARSPYGASKIAARQIVKVYRESYNLYAVQCWCFNYESERRGEEFVTRKITKNVARINSHLLNGEPFEPLQLGNVYSERDWSHAKDFLSGVWKMLHQEEYTKVDLANKSLLKEYVFSSDQKHSVKDFVEKAFYEAGIYGVWHGQGQNEEFSISSGTQELFDAKSSVLVKINPKFYRPAEVSLLYGDSSKAREELGWKPKISFEEMVSRMVQNDINLTSK